MSDKDDKSCDLKAIVGGRPNNEPLIRIHPPEDLPPLPDDQTAPHPRTRESMAQIGDEFRALAHFHGVTLVGIILDEGPDGQGGRPVGHTIGHACTVPELSEAELMFWGANVLYDCAEAVDGDDQAPLRSPLDIYTARRKQRMKDGGQE